MAFIVATCVSVTGTAFGLLGATGATTAAGGTARGGLYSGIFLSAMFVASACTVPYAPRFCMHRSIRAAYALIQAVNALAYLGAGAALLAGAPTMPTLLIAAPFAGATSGVSAVLRPLLSKAYFASENTAHSYAIVSVASGVAWAAGGLAGGALLSHVEFGWGLVINAVLSAGLIYTAARIAPATEPGPPRVPGRPWHDAWKALSDNRALRWSAALGAMSMVLLAPATSLVVPIAESLRQKPQVAGAGYLMASFALGELATPWIVKVFSRRSANLAAGAFSAGIAGLTLVTLGVASLVFSRRVELAVWLVIGVTFGAFRFAARSFYVGSAAESGSAEDAASNLAAGATVALFAAPVGTLLYSLGIDAFSADTTVLVAGGLAIAFSATVLRAARSLPGPAAPTGS